MASQFPAAFDAFPDPPPGASAPLTGHAQRHAAVEDAVTATQIAIGVSGSTDPASLEHRVSAAATIAAGADAAITAHQQAVDPHPAYTTQAEVDARVAILAPQETASSLGTLISGAVKKTNPVDADAMSLSDSAGSGALKRVTWAALKAALAAALTGAFDALYARLAGAPGGQTICGGSGAGENLTLSSTANAARGKVLFGSSAYDESAGRLGIGTQSPIAPLHVVTPVAEQVRLGYNSSAFAQVSVSSTGVLTLAPSGGSVQCRTTRSTAALGAELLTNGAFAADLTGWTDSGSSWSWSAGAAAHAPGSISTLSQSITVQSGATYEISFTLTGRTAGSIGVALGEVGVVLGGASMSFSSSANRTVTAGVSGQVALSVTPTSDFNGALDAISVKLVTMGSVIPAMALVDATGANAFEARASAAPLNCGLGIQAQRSIVAGTSNTGVGSNAQYSLTDGVSNCCLGTEAQVSLVNGSGNSALGRSAQYNLLNGYDNSALGSYAQHYLIDGFGNVSIGARAGRYLADGVTPATSYVRCVHIGDDTRISAPGASNEIALGKGAVGLGSNTAVIGTSSITMTKLFGDINLDKTITPSGTTGAQTINRTIGSVNFAPGASSLLVTNARVSAASVIVCTVGTADATLKSVAAVAAAGSFTIWGNAAATGETRVNFIVIN